MGIRGELYSTKVSLENRTYFFNVKENRVGDLYLNIVESKNKDTGGFDRQSVVLFADDLQDFLKGFDDSLRVMEKAVREKKKTPAAEARGRDRAERTDRSDREDRSDRSERDQGRPFKGRGDRDDRDQARSFKPRGEKVRDDRPKKPFADRDAGAFDGRKKFVKKSAHTAGTHGIKGPLHKGRIVKAVKRRDIPED